MDSPNQTGNLWIQPTVKMRIRITNMCYNLFISDLYSNVSNRLFLDSFGQTIPF